MVRLTPIHVSTPRRHFDSFNRAGKNLGLKKITKLLMGFKGFLRLFNLLLSVVCHAKSRTGFLVFKFYGADSMLEIRLRH